MDKLFFIVGLLCTTIFSGSVQANEIDSQIRASVIITKNNPALKSNIFPARKEIYLIDPKLTPQQIKMILKYHPKKTHEFSAVNNITLPNKVFIGMNGVPVLDQGRFGTCVTFANTAAVDVLLGKGDYISQLCSLELGEYLHDKAVKINLPSGWWGASGEIILNQLMRYGFINKTNQKAKSCGGLTEYPANDTDPTVSSMSLDEFQAIREDLFFGPTMVKWDSLLTTSQRYSFNPANPIPPYDGYKILMQVKQFLASAAAKTKDNPIGIVTFGAFLPYKYCSAGACARHNEADDTWALTKAISKIDTDELHPFELANHEMIIMGYDDEAIAIDNEGDKHQGLFLIRNSHGDDVGDHGNYYMTYDFFEKFVNEVQLIYQPEYPLL